MSYELAFHAQAWKEWQRLAKPLQQIFKQKLQERLHNPHVPSARLSGGAALYKIKLRQAGYRLVYRVDDQTITVLVLAIGKRDKNAVYQAMLSRIQAGKQP